MSLLSILKNETASQHQALEDQLDLLKRAASKPDYRTLMARFFGIYEPLERRLAEAADWRLAGWDFDGRRKTGWLIEDLRHLGMDDAALAALPRCADLPATDSLGAAIGCLYVLEGSTLGGQFISRQLRDTLGINAANGARFFNGYAEQTGPRWKEFGQWAESQADRQPDLVPAAVSAAGATFGAFSRWFDR